MASSNPFLIMVASNYDTSGSAPTDPEVNSVDATNISSQGDTGSLNIWTTVDFYLSDTEIASGVATYTNLNSPNAQIIIDVLIPA